MSKQTNADAYFDWIAAVAVMPYPTADGVSGALGVAKMKAGAKWSEFRLFLVYTFTEFGAYGRKMFASQATIAEAIGKSRPSVRAWLELAEALGLIVKTADATPVRPATYEISDGWQVRLAEAPTVANSGSDLRDRWQQMAA